MVSSSNSGLEIVKVFANLRIGISFASSALTLVISYTVWEGELI